MVGVDCPRGPRRRRRRFAHHTPARRAESTSDPRLAAPNRPERPPKRFFRNWLLTSIAIAVAAFIVPGIQPFGAADPWLSFSFVGLFLGLVNSLVKPLITVISLPLTCLTVGLFQLVVNSFMLELASWLSVNLLGSGISISGFGAALLGSIIVSIVCTILGVATND